MNSTSIGINFRFVSSSDPGGDEEINRSYLIGREPVHYRYPVKIRCQYCKQKQSADNNQCEKCGAPLPDD